MKRVVIVSTYTGNQFELKETALVDISSVKIRYERIDVTILRHSIA